MISNKERAFHRGSITTHQENSYKIEAYFTHRNVDGLWNLFLRLHGYCPGMPLCRLVTHILLELVGWWSLTLHWSRTTHLLYLAHASHPLGGASAAWLLLSRYTPRWHLTDASCTWNLPSSWHSLHTRGSHLLLWLHGLPAGTHLLHLWCEKWTLTSL